MTKSGRPRNGAELIAHERDRQRVIIGYSDAHDDAHDDGELWKAAVGLCCRGEDVHFEYTVKPKDVDWIDKLADEPRNRIDALTIAGAMIAAEIDRLIREERKAVTDPAGHSAGADRNGR